MQIFKYLRPYTFSLIILILLTVGQVAANLELPDYTAKIINEGIVNGDQDIILPTGLEMLGIALIGGILTIMAGYLSSKIGTGFARDLRKGLFTKVENFSLAEVNKFSTSSLITRSTNDVNQIQVVLVMVLRMVLSAPITAVWAIVKATDTAPDMTWIMALAVVTLLVVIFTLFGIAIPKFQLVQDLTDKLNLVARENLTGIRVIRAFNNQEHEKQRLTNVNTDLTNTNLIVSRITAFMQPVMFLIMNLVTVAVVWVGAHLIETGALGIGDMLAFMQYALQVIISFLLISIVFIMVPRALVSAKRVIEVLNVDPSIHDPETPRLSEETGSLDDKGIKKGVIDFKDVTFGYNQADVPVLENITFTAKPGQTTAIIGSTGSGKSTLINLIPRFYDVLFGEIQVDGVNIKDITQEELRSKIGYIPQRPVLFSGTVKTNISYGSDDMSDEKVQNAAEIAQATEFIEKLSDKYETHVSQSGLNLSGGQKQRVSIARAIAKNPEIYIFDDTFSALDFKTESKLRHALSEEVKDKTVIVVAQRVNTILSADQIIVLDQGRIVGIGKHEELMQSCTVYQEIAKSQLSEQELAKYKEDHG